MGKRVIPIDVQLAKGNPNRLTKAEIEKRKKAEEKLTPKKDKIKCPSWLDKEAKKEWRRIYKELEELNLLTNVDITALAIYCDAYSKYIKANKEIEEKGMFVEYTNKAGATNTIENPAINTAKKYADIIRRMCAEFGLTPSARAKLALPKAEEKEIDPITAKFGDI